jgi:hypothetical protein
MRNKPLLTLLSTATLSALAALSVPATLVAAPALPAAKAVAKDKITNAWIVQLVEKPVSAYTGGIKGLKATRPGKGQKIDPNSPAVVNYMAFLESRQNEVLAKVGGGKKLYSYGYVFNGFAAELTEAQVQRLAQMPGVVAVTRNEIHKLDTSSTPAFLGLSGPTGFWNTQAKGEDVIIGIVDSGIWPEHPSFSDRTGSNGNVSKDGKLAYRQIPGWNGKCQPGESFAASNCNQKLIGARFYNAGYGGNAAIKAAFPYEFNSPRDADGHGSHTASTSGGNANVPATGEAALLGSISGIAPRARIAAYKVCWGNNGEGGCPTVDSVAAIDQAVADGVDVINFSISGTTSNFRSAVEIAFLFAADAGVFVAASAGNSGPTVSTVAHPSPWITTVAAGTHDRNGAGSATTGDGMTYPGASFATAVPAKPLVDAAAIVASGANATEAELCFPGTLDAAAAEGKVVLCKRGAIALVDKSRAVAEAGGAGMILYNDPAGATNLLALFHSVPAVHVTAANGLAVKAYIIAQGASATASIAKATVTYDLPAPLTASFSSRGPLVGASGNLLKPDIIAPGQDILAAVSPIGYNGKTFDLLSGTSMSSPHIAGMAALMKELNPTWSPMMIKSALMTTAGDVLDGPNTNPLVIFRQGAGHVRINAAANPGLVFDSGWNDWLSFLCGVQPGGGCSGVTPMLPSELNVPSIAFGTLPGTQRVTRRVTNVSGSAATFNSSVSGMAGFTVTVSPSPLTLAAGETKEISVTVTRTTAPLNAYTGGQLTWSDGLHTVRIPIVARPVALAAPTQVGAGRYDVTFGYTGPFTATPRGLIEPVLAEGTVAQDPDQTFTLGDLTGTVAIPILIPAGTTYTRFALFNSDVSPGSDLDVFVYQGSTLVGVSTNDASNEEVNFVFANPTGGPIALTVYVHGWGIAGGTTSPFKLHQWYLGTAPAGNMTVSAPASAVQGETGTITIETSGLAPATRYLGSVVYSGAAGMPNPTIVRVDTP